MPSANTGRQDASLVSDPLEKRYVPSINAGSHVWAGDTHPVGGLLRAQNLVALRNNASLFAAKQVLQGVREVRAQLKCGRGCQGHVSAYGSNQWVQSPNKNQFNVGGQRRSRSVALSASTLRGCRYGVAADFASRLSGCRP